MLRSAPLPLLSPFNLYKKEGYFHLYARMIFHEEPTSDRKMDFGFKPPSSEKLLGFEYKLPC